MPVRVKLLYRQHLLREIRANISTDVSENTHIFIHSLIYMRICHTFLMLLYGDSLEEKLKFNLSDEY